MPSVSRRMAWACLAARRRGPRSGGGGCRSRGPGGRSECRGVPSSPVALDDAGRHQLGQPGRLVAAGLDGVEGFRLQLLARGIGGVEVADLGVEIPAVVVEARAPRELGHLVAGLAVHVAEADHDVRDLHAGVVDVVLHAHVTSPVPEHVHEGVAEDGVAQVADVGRLVRVDAGVLDDHVPAHPHGRPGIGHPVGHVAREGSPVEEHVDVAAARHLRLAHPGRLRQFSARRSALARLAPRASSQSRRGGTRSPGSCAAGSGTRPPSAPRRRRHEPPRARLLRAGNGRGGSSEDAIGRQARHPGL